jgi:superoxide dismutase, Fe-Mn family
MATRRTFLHNAAAVGAGIMLAQAQTVHAAEDLGYSDKVTDADGKYAAGPLPFAYDALEPVIDARTVDCTTTFTTSPLWWPRTRLKTDWRKRGTQTTSRW